LLLACAKRAAAPLALSMQPVKSAYTRPRETRNQRIAWYTLAVTTCAAGFMRIRRACFPELRMEGNPLLAAVRAFECAVCGDADQPAVMI